MIASYFRCLRQQYNDTYRQGLGNTRPVQNADYLQLGSLACFLLLAAFILFSSDGYQVWFKEINAFSPSVPAIVLHCVTSFGDGALILALILLCAPKHVQFHWVAFIAALVGGLVSNMMKDYFSADRPPAVYVEEAINIVGKAYHRNSFPSGHTLTAFLIASTAYFFIERKRTKWLLLLTAAGVGISRVLVGVHWPIDVLVGAALGIFCGMFAVSLATLWQRFLSKPMHLFILCLLFIACCQVMLQKKDYPYANFLLFAVAILGLLQGITHYLLPHGSRELRQQSKAWQQFFAFWQHPFKLFLCILVALTLYRIAVILQPHMALFYDEAYYYHWSLYPDLGYYSKPPMVAWSIWLSTHLVGHSTLGIKLSAPLLYGASALLIYALAKRISGKALAGLYAGIIFLCIPLVGFNSEFITTDAPLFFFWSATLYLFFIALDSNKFVHWLLLGIACGLGMLSKYTMGALPLGLFLYLAYSKHHRGLLRQLGPWLAAVVAGLLFALNIFWNFQHDWIAAKHTQEISQTSGTLFRFAPLVGFIATQFIIFGPVWSYLLIKHLREQFRSAQLSATQREALVVLIFSSAVILAAIALQAFLSRAFANWAGPWMIGASILLALCLIHLPKKWLVIGAVSQLLLLSTFYHWPTFAQKVSIPLSKKTDPYFRVLGWQALGEQLLPIRQQYSDALLTSNSRDLIAYMGYYSAPKQLNFARWQPKPDNIRDWYDLKFNLRQYQNAPEQAFLFISNKVLPIEIQQQFAEIEHISSMETPVYTNFSRRLEVYIAKGFQGYGE